MNESIFSFIGVSTQGSSILKLFPRWMDELGFPNSRIDGVNLPLHAPIETYRQAVRKIAEGKNHIGALVTTHKIDLFHAASDLFDELDDNAQLCGEISCIAKRGSKLHGFALDPISAGRTLDEMLGTGYFTRTGGEVLCLGAGGAAAAIALNFANRSVRADRPTRFTVVDIASERLDHLQEMLRTRKCEIEFHYHLAGDNSITNDQLIAQLPAGSLVINATGMGKDRPGSPISDGAIFPKESVVWELNYRGERQFLQQALRQMNQQKLQIYDGWRYFLHGWIEHITTVFQIEIDSATFDRLATIADEVR